MCCRQPGNYRDTGFWEIPNAARDRSSKSQAGFATSSVCNRTAFARGEPAKPDCDCVVERKARHSDLLTASSPFSPVPFVCALTRKMGMIRVFRGEMRREFSAVQTAWRRERDSNPRYGFPYSGFQDRPFQPLTHPSAGKQPGLHHFRLVYNRPDQLLHVETLGTDLIKSVPNIVRCGFADARRGHFIAAGCERHCASWALSPSAATQTPESETP